MGWLLGFSGVWTKSLGFLLACLLAGEMGDDHVYAKARSRGGCFLSTAREEKQLRELCVIHRVSDSIITIHRWLCRRLSKTCP